MLWHKVELSCPKCSQEPTILNLLTSADSEILLDMVCVPCGLQLAWKATSASLICRSLIADQEQEKRQEKKPQKLLPPVKQKVVETTEETQWLHDMGIGGVDIRTAT